MNQQWWTKFYDQHLATLLLVPASGKEVLQTCDFLEKVLKLNPEDRIFDQCCGTGRLSIELGLRDFSITGIDQADIYIQQAKRDATTHKIDAHYATADAFIYETDKLCDAAFNWWTSFGYSDDDQQNVKMLQRAYTSLRPGGLFALDYMNVPNLYRNFQPSMITRRKTDDGELVLLRESRIDSQLDILHKKWTYHLPSGEKVEHDSSTRLYTPRQLRQLFMESGFHDMHFYGDTDYSPLSLQSPRCIITGNKPTS